MKMLAVRIITAVALMMAYAGSIHAAEDQGAPEQTPSGAVHFKSIEDLLGMQVVTRNGEEIGEISDVKLDPQSGRIQHVTVAKKGFLGFGGRKVAAPLEIFQFDDQQAILMVEENRLDNAPRQAEVADERYERDLQEHYGLAPAWREPEAETESTRSTDRDSSEWEPAPQTNIDSQDNYRSLEIERERKNRTDY